MRAVFCGTPEFAVPALVAMAGAGHEIPLVVSQPDRVRGRRGQPLPSPVRARALELGLATTVLERGGRDALYGRILDLAPDVVVVVAFGHIIREPLLHGARFGCVNVHASLLPRWRGPAPIHTAIVNGDPETGVCTMKLEAGVDTGDVYERASLTIGADETTGTLHDRLADLGSRTLLSTLARIGSGDFAATPQATDGITHAPMLERTEGSVDFGRDAIAVHNRIRGMQPWPGITVQWEGRRLKLFDSQPASTPSPGAPGVILALDADGMTVCCGQGAVRIGRLQVEGKRAGAAGEFAHGHGMRVGQVLASLADYAPREPRA